VIAHLLAHEHGWRRALGDEAQVGAFLGRQDAWRRVSEIWPDPDLGASDLGLEIAARLVDYVTALEPVATRSQGVGQWDETRAGATGAAATSTVVRSTQPRSSAFSEWPPVVT